MAAVIFNPATLKAAYPEFADVPDARLQGLFDVAAATILDNTGASPVTDLGARAALFNLLVCHQLALYGTGVAGAANGGPSGAVGRVASATEGSVSSSLEYKAAASATEAWFNQTPYGAQYWAMTVQWRSFRYGIVGRSGVGRSLDFLNPHARNYAGNWRP